MGSSLQSKQPWRGLPNEVILQIIEQLTISGQLHWGFRLVNKRMQQLVDPSLFTNINMTSTRLEAFIRAKTKSTKEPKRSLDASNQAAQHYVQHARNMIISLELLHWGKEFRNWVQRVTFPHLETFT